MEPNSLVEKLFNIFIKQSYGTPMLDDEELGINHGIRIIPIEDPNQLKGWHYRNDKAEWLSDENITYNIGMVEFQNHPYWDVKNDGSEIMYFKSINEFYFYTIEQLNREEINNFIEKRTKKENEKSKREEALNVLTEKLVIQMPTLNYLFTGDLEINHGVHLKEIKRGMYKDMPYKPRYGKVGWVANEVMNWGACIGWDISLDGKIVCCRVHYDDYINFEIELLSEQDKEMYKTKYQQSDKSLINRLATLAEMFEKKLISKKEFQVKKNEILQAV